MNKKLGVLLTWCFACLFINAAKAAPTTIDVWCYYFAPPFKFEAKAGLANEFVALLNKQFADRYQFKLRFVPRQRLNTWLDEGKQGVVLFVNWVWMEDKARERFLWTPAILRDQNEIISAAKRPIEYHGPDSLKGLRFGGGIGRKYTELEPLFAAGVIKRYDVAIERQVLGMIAEGRLDVTSQPRSLALALSKQLGLSQKLHFSQTPHFTFTRHLLVTQKLPLLHRELSDLSQRMASLPGWLELTEKHHLLPVDH